MGGRRTPMTWSGPGAPPGLTLQGEGPEGFSRRQMPTVLGGRGHCVVGGHEGA